jgi:TRAP transporter TAXI family solute receptor
MAWALALALPALMPAGTGGAALAQDKLELVWAGSSLTSTSYNHAAATAAVINKYSPRIKINVVPSSGSVEIARLLNIGQVDMGISNTQIGYDAYNAKGVYEGAPPIKKMRLLWHIVAGVTHVMVRNDSDLKTVADLKGKRIATVRKGSSAYVQAVDLLKNFGITMDDVQAYGYSHSEGVTAFKDGNVDAVVQGGSLRAAPVMQATSSVPTRFLGLTEADWQRLKSSVPEGYYSRFVIPANTYENQAADVLTFAIPSYWATTSDLPEDAAYELAKIFFEHRDEAIRAVATIAETTLEKQKLAAPIPWHPGTRRYFEEQGVFK